MHSKLLCYRFYSVFMLCCIILTNAETHYHTFEVKSSKYTRLCNSKPILTVNGEYPGPPLKGYRGDKFIINVINKANYNITIHWHGLRQFRNPWVDGPEFITQCPIRPGKNFTYTISSINEEGTIWWHAHNEWARATVHGALIIYPKRGSTYPFPKPHAEVPIILAEWWKTNTMEIPHIANKTGAEPQLSDAYTMNGQPGYFYPCSKQDTFKLTVEYGKRYLLRIVNAVMDTNLFFAIADHNMTLVGKDGIYLKPFQTEFIMITPGQTMDLILEANQTQRQDQQPLYFMAARSYASAVGSGYDNTTTTGILQYVKTPQIDANYDILNLLKESSLRFPALPPYNSTEASTDFTTKFRSLQGKYKKPVPLEPRTHLLFTISVNLLNCSAGEACTGPFGRRFAATLNNVSFVEPTIDILQAYYYNIGGVFGKDFPGNPRSEFNYTGDDLPQNLLTPSFGTEAIVLKYNSSVELVLQGTSLLASDNHPIHLHGYSFHVVGSGFGNFDSKKDPLNYNLVDPPEETTVGVPKNGWVAVRFIADNPGVWMLHCHIERHATWGMSTVFIVKNGKTKTSKIVKPPPDLPKCSA